MDSWNDNSRCEDSNVTAVEVISERLAEVTRLAEGLDSALCGSQGEPVALNMDKILDGTASTTPEEWYNSLNKPERSKASGVEDSSKSEEDFVTASECTCTPPSRSSSFHTASEGEAGSPWWELDPSDHEHDAKDSKVVVQEVTETRHLKLSRTEGCSITTNTTIREYHTDNAGNTAQVSEKNMSVHDESDAVSPSEPTEPTIETEPADQLADNMKQSADWLELRVVEVTPSLTQLGGTLAEATNMFEAHEQVIAKIQSKQSPVEELLRQADQLIAGQHTRAEVYAAMAESLSLAWQDINTLLQRRLQILQINVQYHSDAAVCLDRTRALELACSSAPLPVEVSELRTLLARLGEVKRSMLEALMAALQDGRSLLDNLRQLADEGSLDSRPGYTKASTQAAIAQVERWLEELHDRRRMLEVSWQARRTQLEQCLALALLTTDLQLLEQIYSEREESLSRNLADLGDSPASGRLLLEEHDKLIPEAKELQEQGLKILRATEQLAATGHFAGDDAIAQAYQLLNTSTEYQEQLERRHQNLQDAILFFTDANMTLLNLEKVEKELAAPKSPVSSNQLRTVQESIAEMCAPVLKQGYGLLEAVPGARGLQNVVEELENRKLNIAVRCSALQEENKKVNEALRIFFEKHDKLQSWLVNTTESVIQGHQDMGSVLAVAKDFLQQHHTAANELQMKGTEINALLSTLPDLLPILDEANRTEVESKAEALRGLWARLRETLERRIELVTKYVKFHSLVVELAGELDPLTERLSGAADPNERHHLEERLQSVKQLSAQLENTADNFQHDSNKPCYGAAELRLATDRARLCVDTLRTHFADRVANLHPLWSQYCQLLEQQRLTAQRWANNMTESSKTVDWVSKLDSQLYPVLPEGSASAKALVRQLEEKRDRVLTEIRQAQAEVQLRITTADEILAQAEVQPRDGEVLRQLKGLQERLQQVITDYQVLLEMFIGFFKNLAELEHTVQGLESQYGAPPSTQPLDDVEKALREHDASRQAIQELFKFAHTESLQIIGKIRQQEPESSAEKDIDGVRRMLETQRSAWERAWAQHRLTLESQQQLGQFNADLAHIHASLDDLSQQLAKVKGQFGEDLAAAKATSLAFHYFEKTIQLLEQRIETFMGAGDTMLKSKHASSPHIQAELISLRTRWHSFHQQVNDTRQLIDLSLQYFELVEEAEEWFREGSRLLMTIAKKSSAIRSPQEATDLLQEIELFLKPGEARQEERIQKITELAVKLYGTGQPDQLHQVKTESKEMIDSFSQVSLELQQIVNFLNQPPEEQRMAIVGIQQALPIEMKSERKSPSPPPKKAKVDEPEDLPPNFTLPLHDATIDEGSRFTFECRVTGTPMPEVCWLKDNISIDSNLDYHTKVEPDGLCSLTIEETFTEDSACFTCRGTNHLGFAETTALLTVRENERERPPVFVRLLAPITSKEGSPISLVCKVEGTPLPTVQWFKDGVCIDSAPEYSTTYNNGEAVLSVEKLRKEDQGTFSCQATNRLGSETTAATLIVQSLVSEKAPLFVTPLSNVMARAGQKVRLECEVSGVPEPQIEWAHNGKPLPDTRDIKIHQDGGKVVLTIAEAFPKDAGSYSLTAVNSAGRASGSCSLAVKGRLPTETSDSELASDLEPTKPSVATTLRDSAVKEGEIARLDCVIVGQPEPEVIWYHEGVPVKESKEVQLLFQGDRCSLIIAESLPEDAGMYKVVAINSAGEASSACRLNVQSAVPELPMNGSKPVFISLLTDALATEGDSITLECAVWADPLPTVTWSLNNQPLVPSDRIKTEHEPGGLCTLRISPVLATDKGNYTARATNPLGEAKCFAHLIVKSATNHGSGMSVAEDVRAAPAALVPAFTELFADRAVPEGTSTKFECIVTGKPTPKVRWLYNDEPVSGKDFLPSVSGMRQVLTIPAVTKTLAGGKVTCTAENEAGKSSCAATLTITDAPPAEDLLTSIDRLNLSESSVLEVKREVFMQTTSHSQFGNGEPTVQVHGVASRSEQTSKKIGDQPAIQTESHKTSEYHHENGVEQKVDTQSQSTTLGSPTALVPTRAPSRRQVTPRFTSPLMGKIVDQGTDVVLECIMEGFPTPSVTWKKNGQELVENGRVRTEWKLNKAQVQMDQVTAEDSGKYTCTAVNPAGSASCTADLVVKKNVFPPVFGRRLHGDTIPVGQRAVLEVEVTGTPEPAVSWYKDGQLIASSSSMYRIISQGTSNRLVIENAAHAHSGRYEARAVNTGGEARSAADLWIVEPQELGLIPAVELAMDIPVSSEFTSTKHTVSVTESFKSDKKISIQVGHPTAASDPLLDLPPFSVRPLEAQSQTISQQSFESVKKEEKIVEPEVDPPVKKVEEPTPTLEENVVEDSSISKKSALSFFKNIIKENEEEAKTKETKPGELVQKPFVLEPLPPLQSLPPVSFETPVLESSTTQESQKFESIYINDGFVLQPEPPPEMGFISKDQVSNIKDDLASKKKKLEESHKALSKDQIPSGAVKIFPTPVEKVSTPEYSATPKPSPLPTQNISSETISTQTSLQEQSFFEPPKPSPFTETSSFSESTFEQSLISNPPQEIPLIKPPVTFKVAKFELPKKTDLSHQEVSESFSSYQSSQETKVVSSGDFDIPHFEPLAPIVRPSADIQLRPQSPRPSAEGIHMEKLWATKKNEEYIEFPHASPSPVQPTEEHFEQFKSEKTSKFEEITRSVSPLPSATGLAMEKLWAPMAEHPRPLSSLSGGERPKSPSAEGLAMDKLWAHKTTTQKKVWPPPQPVEEVQQTPPWTNKVTGSVQPLPSDTCEISMQKESFTDKNVKYETKSFSKVESSSSSSKSSNFSENIIKSDGAFKEVKPVQPYIPPPQSVPPESKIIYVAEAHASHSVNLPPVQPQYITTETNFTTSSQTMQSSEKITQNSTIVEEKTLRPSEAVKLWPPGPKEEIQQIQPTIQKHEFQRSFQKQEFKKEFSSAIPSNSVLDDIPLEPGPPPEIGYAEPPPRRQSYVETIEQNLEKDIDKVPSKHLAGAVRIIPPPMKKEQKTTFESKITKADVMKEEKQPYVPESISKPLPVLEPFPFKPDLPKNRPARCPPPPKPSRFVKGSFTESDYESDCDSIRIAVKWNPWQSDSEDYGYRKVKAPVGVPTKRPHSATGQIVPPTEFEKPAPLQGPTKSSVTSPEISKSAKSKIIKTEETHQKTNVSKIVQTKTPQLKPGSPPKFFEAPAPKHKPSGKPGSPKTKPKNIQPLQPGDGYMADTDEPSRQYKMAARTEESTTMRTEQTMIYEQSRSEVKTTASAINGSKTSAKKESLKTEIKSSTKKDELPLEPFPFKPDPVRPSKRSLGPPPPSPSKFIKGEFRESDYESEYEGKILPIWRPHEPADDKTFRPVRPVLTPVQGKTQNSGRIPTPPTQFDEPPNFSGPPRPKFEPIDKPSTATKVKETVIEKTNVIRPTPVQAQPPSPMETIYATPASKLPQEFVLKPGSPPRMAYAPPPGYVEKSNIVNFTESTANSKRIVSVQHTTRVMQFGQNQVRKENITPNKFVPAYSRDSDFESDVDGAAVRTPYIDAEKKRLKRVEEMKKKFLESEPQLQPGPPPEYAYVPEPSKVAYSAASKQMSEMTQTFKGKTQKFVSDIMTDIKTNQNATVDRSILKPPGDEPQTYRDESRLSEYGSKHIDPETGLIYFKYDFGYEFGIVLPGEGKPGSAKKVVSGPSVKEEGAIDFPVIHETTQKKKPVKVKTVKWEPTSESEMSEIESERMKRVPLAKFNKLQTPSPHSLSPHPSAGRESAVSPGSPWLGSEGASIVRAVSPSDLPKRAPIFITPLRDIACVSGQPARFECIVLAEPVPSVTWFKDGSVLQPSPHHQMEYRNGVCRMVLSQARPVDAGTYTCAASNPLGSTQTSASLQVPGERRSLYA